MSGRRFGYRIKGPVFASFRNQNTGMKKILVWKPGTQSTRQQKRNLRNRCRAYLDSKDELIITAGDRVIRAVCGEPDPEFSSLHLFCAGMDMSEESGESWVTCINYLMDKFEAEKEIPPDATTASGNQDRSRRRGLLRTLVSRAFRSGDEASADADQHQHAGDVDSQQPEAGQEPGLTHVAGDDAGEGREEGAH